MLAALEQGDPTQPWARDVARRIAGRLSEPVAQRIAHHPRATEDLRVAIADGAADRARYAGHGPQGQRAWLDAVDTPDADWATALCLLSALPDHAPPITAANILSAVTR